MGEELRPRRLGRGLAALIGEAAEVVPAADRGHGQRRVPIEFLRPNPRNPRINFRESDLADLAASIREKGVIQPIIVRTIPGLADAYEIVAGERRWRAAQLAHLSDIPVVIHELDDREALELAIVENVQRADLDAIEEARGYQRLIEEFGYAQGDLAKVIGKSRPHVANTLRLLQLPPATRRLVSDGEISAGPRPRAALAEVAGGRRGAHRRRGADRPRRRAHRAKGSGVRAGRRAPVRKSARRSRTPTRARWRRP